MAKAEQITEMLAPAVAALDLELLGVEYRPSSHAGLLRLYIDAPGRAVGIDDCERVSREVSALLDVNDPISGQYTLEVSSPGLDRPLFTVEQVARHLGAEARFSLNLPQDGRRRLQGTITGVEGDSVVLDVEGVSWRVAFDNVERARLVPDKAFPRAAAGRDDERRGPGRRRRDGGRPGGATQ